MLAKIYFREMKFHVHAIHGTSYPTPATHAVAEEFSDFLDLFEIAMRTSSDRYNNVIFPLPEITTVDQTNNVAASPPPSEAGEPGNATNENSQKAPPPKSDGGLRARMMRLFDTKRVPYEPAERFEGDWKSSAAQQICQHWVDSQTTHNASTISLVALSKMKALDYERGNRDSIPPDQRLLPGNATKQDYYDAQIRAFLEAVGAKGNEADAILESFKLAGTGGLHRQHVTAGATVANTLGAAAQIVPDLTAKAVLSGVRMVALGLTAERLIDSGWRRLRNAGTEDMLPLGRADATPAAKQAPNILQASHAVIWQLRGAKKNLRKMEAAIENLENARAMPSSQERVIEIEKAKKNLEMAFARICYQTTVKAKYKASAESAKIEFRGNQRYLSTGYTGFGLTMGAGLFSIATPYLVGAIGTVAAGAVTGGVGAGAALIALALYVGYQLSKGPSKDGEAKAKRAIVALSKSLDVLSGDSVASQKKRADAYKTYIEEKKTARFALPGAKAKAKEKAREKLLARLEEITREDKVENLINPRQNWEAYRELQTQISQIKKDGAEADMQPEQISEQIRQLEDQFQAAHKADFSAKNIADAWKVPMRMRMDTAKRLLAGKVAKSHKHLIQSSKLLVNLSPHAVWRKEGIEREIERIKKELGKNLRDMFNLELALRQMKPLINGNGPAPEAMARAAAAIGAIEDKDVRSVFCGNAREQVDATNESKKLTFGEAERYTYTNAGASTLGIGLNVAVGGVDLGLNAAKAAHAVHVGLHNPNPEGKPRIPQFNDYKFTAISQAGAPLTAHMNAGDRAAFQKTQMSQLSAITKSKGDAVVKLVMEVTGGRTHLGKDDDEVTANLDALIELLRSANAVPDKITLSMTRQASDAASPSSQPVNAAPETITVDLQTTSAYHHVKYKNASVKEKGKVIKKQAAIIGRQALVSFAGLPAQAMAQYNLRKTRAALDKATELSPDIRRTLGDLSHMDTEADSQSPSMVAPPASPPPESPRTTAVAPTAREGGSESGANSVSIQAAPDSPSTSESNSTCPHSPTAPSRDDDVRAPAWLKTTFKAAKDAARKEGESAAIAAEREAKAVHDALQPLINATSLNQQAYPDQQSRGGVEAVLADHAPSAASASEEERVVGADDDSLSIRTESFGWPLGLEAFSRRAPVSQVDIPSEVGSEFRKK